MRRLLMAIALTACTAGPVVADTTEMPLFPARSRAWDRVLFQAPQDAQAPPSFAAAVPQTAPPPKLSPVEYSDAYKMRARIHKYASVAMLPLVGTEWYLGNKTYNDPTSGTRSAHIAVGSALVGLFAVNTVTGAWNMWEARKDPNGRTKRMLHGLLMMAADVGFMATLATAPGRDRFEDEGRFGSFIVTGGGSRGAHRALAIASFSTATVGYLVMLFGGH